MRRGTYEISSGALMLSYMRQGVCIVQQTPHQRLLAWPHVALWMHILGIAISNMLKWQYNKPYLVGQKENTDR